MGRILPTLRPAYLTSTHWWVQRPEMHHRSNKFLQRWFIHYGDIAIFRFFKMAPFAILDLFEAYLNHPQMVLGSLYQYYCAKFGCDRCSSFDNVKVSIFGAFGLNLTPLTLLTLTLKPCPSPNSNSNPNSK